MYDEVRARQTMEALVHNPGAPADVLLRLLADEAQHVWSFLAWRALPDEVVDAILVHPAPQLRKGFAANIEVDAAQRARLIDDPDPKVRRALAAGPHWGSRMPEPPLPEWAQRRLLADPVSRVRIAAAHCRLTDARLVAELADDPMPVLRLAACEQWPVLAAEVRERLLTDPDGQVRLWAARQAAEERPDCADFVIAEDGDQLERLRTTERALLTDETARRLAVGSEEERVAVAMNGSTPLDVVRVLAVDESPAVRVAAAGHPGLTEAERAEINYLVRPDDVLRPAQWVLRATDPGVLRACARSAHLLLRRSAARHKALPLDVVEVLARDDDYIVRLLLCENQPTVPSEVVLQTYLDCPFITKGDLLRHPRFPTEGNAARYAEATDPELRYLATLDPEIGTEALVTLTGDAVLHVRNKALSHPGLPIAVLMACYEREATRLAALRNPGLPPEVMHQELDEAGVPTRRNGE